MYWICEVIGAFLLAAVLVGIQLVGYELMAIILSELCCDICLVEYLTQIMIIKD